MSTSLSFLIPTIPSRIYDTYPKMIVKLLTQIESLGAKNIEILSFFDNKKRTVGAKRNGLLQMAKGDYIAFLDDDDDISSDYVSTIYHTILLHPGVDVVVFNISRPRKRQTDILGKFDIAITGQGKKGALFTSFPTHNHVWRANLAKQFDFPELNYAEDKIWSKKISSVATSQAKIDKTLYYYLFDWGVSETRGRKVPNVPDPPNRNQIAML